MSTYYDNNDCIFYIKERLSFLNTRMDELTPYFNSEMLQKEADVMRSVLDTLTAIEEIKKLPEGEEKQACIDLL